MALLRRTQRRERGRLPIGVYALAFGVFVVGTGEFMLAGLIPRIRDDFAVSTGAAGQVVTVFGLTCAVTAPVATALTGRWSRRPVLIVASVVYLSGSTMSALAPTLPLLFAAQMIAAVGTGLFVPSASVHAAALAPAGRSGQAISTVVTGFTAAVTCGAPLGTAIAAAAGWRGTLWVTTALAGAGVIALWHLLPRGVGGAGAGTGTTLSGAQWLLDRQVASLLATTLIAFTAVYIPYTFIDAMTAESTGKDGLRLAVLMFAVGVTGTVGNLVAGALTDRLGGARVVATALAALAMVLFVMPSASGSFGWTVVMVSLYGLAAFSITVPQQHRLLALGSAVGPLAVSLNQAVLYLAISLSGVVGAISLDMMGASRVSMAAAALAVLAIGASTLAAGMGRRQAVASESSSRPPCEAPQAPTTIDRAGT